ncbi:hypothetical protein [Gloeobacter morelensis]|uniref:hypothetical protein n=1 Tax=Gloeobacter morelensis TaxID=2907343 RepID=UPI001E3D299A|nr:hypothetical protein [Gloeobacter morelensis]UFP97269.1 hypothetical protein ISF26_24415 [Gloeobacter morelensis MG652769]
MALPPEVLEVLAALARGESPVLGAGWVAKGGYWVHTPTWHVVVPSSGEVRKVSLSEDVRLGPKGEHTYLYVVFSLAGKTRKLYLGRK